MVTIVATEQDGFEVRSMAINLEIISDELKSEEDILGAVYNSCNEYIRTDDGKRTYDYNCSSFNWADFETYVPNEICEKYGFKKVSSSMSDISVNWDEHLITREPEDDD